MKERVMILVLLCLLGFGACYFAYKNGPISLIQRNNTPPQGWTPPPMPPEAPPMPSPVPPTRPTPPARPFPSPPS